MAGAVQQTQRHNRGATLYSIASVLGLAFAGSIWWLSGEFNYGVALFGAMFAATGLMARLGYVTPGVRPYLFLMGVIPLTLANFGMLLIIFPTPALIPNAMMFIAISMSFSDDLG